MTEPDTPAVQMSASKNLVAYQDWVADGIKEVDKLRIDTGKFLFTVSSGTIGLFVTVAEFADAKLDAFLVSALLILVFAACLAIRLIIPVLHEGDPAADLEAAHKEHTANSVRLITIWAYAWVLGIALGIGSLYFQGQAPDDPGNPLKVQIVAGDAP